MKPLNVVVPVGKPVTKKLKVKVMNADSGHSFSDQLKLSVTSDCPPAMTIGTPDFVPVTTDVAEDTIALFAGVAATATVPVTFHPFDFANQNAKAPNRCTLTFQVATQYANNADPNPSNNTMPVEVNVVDKNVTEVPNAQETLASSLSPMVMKIGPGASEVIKKIKPKVWNANYGSPGADIGVSYDLNGCAGLTALGFDMDGSVAGEQDSVLVKGKAAKVGTLTLRGDAAIVTSTNPLSPQRCVVRLDAGIAGVTEADPSNNSSGVVVDLSDANDF